MLRICFKFAFALLLSIVTIDSITAQKGSHNSYNKASIELHSIFTTIRNNRDFKVRDSLSNIAQSIFDTVLIQKESFNDPFDTLKNLITCMYSDDKVIRIINWNIPLPNASYNYYCYIQYFDKKEGIFTSTKLKDNRLNIENPTKLTLRPNNWFGALYYEIIPTRIKRKEVVYVLLGWEGYTLDANRKIIDVVSFKKGKPTFGKDFFEFPKSKQKRVIFTYNFRAKMKLSWDKNFGMIIFDNLEKIPSLPADIEGNLAPSMLFDGFIFENNVWKYMHDLDLKPSEKNKKRQVKPYPY